MFYLFFLQFLFDASKLEEIALNKFIHIPNKNIPQTIYRYSTVQYMHKLYVKCSIVHAYFQYSILHYSKCLICSTVAVQSKVQCNTVYVQFTYMHVQCSTVDVQSTIYRGNTVYVKYNVQVECRTVSIHRYSAVH